MLETSAKTVQRSFRKLHTSVSRGLGLKEGNEATITGFMLNDDIAVSQIKTDGATYTLRDETTGRPHGQEWETEKMKKMKSLITMKFRE